MLHSFEDAENEGEGQLGVAGEAQLDRKDISIERPLPLLLEPVDTGELSSGGSVNMWRPAGALQGGGASGSHSNAGNGEEVLSNEKVLKSCEKVGG